jgi:hypothetical protein
MSLWSAKGAGLEGQLKANADRQTGLKNAPTFQHYFFARSGIKFLPPAIWGSEGRSFSSFSWRLIELLAILKAV